jgi:hypothetical protein
MKRAIQNPVFSHSIRMAIYIYILHIAMLFVRASKSYDMHVLSEL